MFKLYCHIASIKMRYSKPFFTFIKHIETVANFTAILQLFFNDISCIRLTFSIGMMNSFLCFSPGIFFFCPHITVKETEHVMTNVFVDVSHHNWSLVVVIIVDSRVSLIVIAVGNVTMILVYSSVTCYYERG